jgi:hypothetical protein
MRYLLDSDSLSDFYEPLTEGCTLISADGIYSDLRRIDPTLRVENWLASI